jgi:hypothetical protein
MRRGAARRAVTPQAARTILIPPHSPASPRMGMRPMAERVMARDEKERRLARLSSRAASCSLASKMTVRAAITR